MDKRERLEKALIGESVDRPPVALWRHWPGDDQRAADLARAAVDFQYAYDWDFVRLVPPTTYTAIDHGIKDARRKDCSGDRETLKFSVTRSLEWTELRTLDPTRGSTGRYVQALQLTRQQIGKDTPLIATVYSPLAQAERVGGRDQLFRDMRTHPDRLRTGLSSLTESLLRFIEALKYEEVDGIAYVIEHACHTMMAEAEYREFGELYDRKVLESLPNSLNINMVTLTGASPLFSVVGSYPVQAINWDAVHSDINITQGRTLFNGAVCTGICSHTHMNMGTPTIIRDAVRSAIQATNGRRLIVAAESPFPVTAPLSNLRAVREAVDQL